MSIAETPRVDTAWSTASLLAHNRGRAITQPIIGACLMYASASFPNEGPIVEIGSGLGFTGQAVPAELRARYIQTEIGVENCHVMSQAEYALPTVSARAQQLPFAAGSVGAIVARNVLDAVDTAATLREVSRVLRPGGVFVHMRDHRPSLSWIYNQAVIARDRRLVPHFDDMGRFIQYRNMSTAAARRLALQFDYDVDTLCNPNFQEDLSKGDQRQESVQRLRELSKDAARYGGHLTPSFGETMTQIIRKRLRAHKFTVTDEVFTAGALYPQGSFGLSTWQWPHNKAEFDDHGYSTSYHDDTLQRGEAEVDCSIALLQAVKPLPS